MAKKEDCDKVCWWTRLGTVLDCVIPLCPKEKKKD
jgi:hypothetical protein